MHSSFFNYAITRPYPYRWFTPVAVVGGLVLLVLLSVLNFVQNSYTLVVQYADNPNSTITNGVWFKHWPSYLTNSVKPACQPTNLPVNTQFFTNQSGLTWTLTGVSTNYSAAGVLPSLPYLNNVFDDCKVHQIQIDFDGSKDRAIVIHEVGSWDIKIRPFLTCGLWGPSGYSLLNLTAMYDADQPYIVAGSSQFIATNATERASMYWAEALLSAHWIATYNDVSRKAGKLDPATNKGGAILYPTKGRDAITDLDFFDIGYSFLFESGIGDYSGDALRYPIENYILHQNISFKPLPEIWKEVDKLAKSMYSAALTDLGQTSSPPQSNIVTNAATIQHYSRDFQRIYFNDLLYYTQLELLPYDARQRSQEPTGPLGLTPSVISTSYLCQVPKRKPLGEIFISVLLADLVLLQAAWKLYTFGVEQALLRKRDGARFCEGCVNGKLTDMEFMKGGVISYVSTPRPSWSDDSLGTDRNDMDRSGAR